MIVVMVVVVVIVVGWRCPPLAVVGGGLIHKSQSDSLNLPLFHLLLNINI